MMNVLQFEPLTLDQIHLFRPYFENRKCRICDCTVGGTFMWRDFFRTQYAIEDGVLYLKVRYYEGITAFTGPLGSDDPETFQRIIDTCRAEGLPVVLCMVTEHYLDVIKKLFPEASARPERDWFDYLYESADIINLSGRKYSGQRNHINRFRRTYPDWSFVKIDKTNKEEVRKFFLSFSEKYAKKYETFKEERDKILEVFDNFSAYRLVGGALKAGDDIVGFSLGEVVGDTLFVHIEKAERNYAGSYQMLVNQFARAYAGGPVAYINREEDDGDEGLRTSKLSYHPVRLLKKYTVLL